MQEITLPPGHIIDDCLGINAGKQTKQNFLIFNSSEKGDWCQSTTVHTRNRTQEAQKSTQLLLGIHEVTTAYAARGILGLVGCLSAARIQLCFSHWV